LDARSAASFYSKALVLILWIRSYMMYRQADTLKIVLGNRPFELGATIKLPDRTV